MTVDREHGLELLRQMLRVRRFEEKCVELYSATKIRGFMHLYIGEEAVAVGAMEALEPQDALYAMGTAIGRYESETDLALKAASYEMTAWPVDGMDVLAVEDATRKAAAEVREGGRPCFLELRTYRFRPTRCTTRISTGPRRRSRAGSGTTRFRR